MNMDIIDKTQHDDMALIVLLDDIVSAILTIVWIIRELELDTLGNGIIPESFTRGRV